MYFGWFFISYHYIRKCQIIVEPQNLYIMLCSSLLPVLESLEWYFVSFGFLVLSVFLFVLHVKAEEVFWYVFWGILCVAAFLSCVVFAFVAHWIYGLFVNFPLCLAAFFPHFLWEASQPISIKSSGSVSWGFFCFKNFVLM